MVWYGKARRCTHIRLCTYAAVRSRADDYDVVRAQGRVHTRPHARPRACLYGRGRIRASMHAGLKCVRLRTCAAVQEQTRPRMPLCKRRVAFLRVPAHTYAVAQERRPPRVRSRTDEAVRVHDRVHNPPRARTLASLSGWGRVRSRMHVGRNHVRSCTCAAVREPPRLQLRLGTPSVAYLRLPAHTCAVACDYVCDCMHARYVRVRRWTRMLSFGRVRALL